jgi:hypothetical protein
MIARVLPDVKRDSNPGRPPPSNAGWRRAALPTNLRAQNHHLLATLPIFHASVFNISLAYKLKIN